MLHGWIVFVMNEDDRREALRRGAVILDKGTDGEKVAKGTRRERLAWAKAQPKSSREEVKTEELPFPTIF